MIKLQPDEEKAIKAGSRKEKYIFELVNKYGIKKTNLEVLNASIEMNMDDEIKRRGSFVFKKNAMMDVLTDSIKPIMMIQLYDGKWARWPKSRYVLSSPVEKFISGEMMMQATCYDASVILQQDTFDEKTTFNAGTKYTDIMAYIFISAGFNKTNISPNENKIPADLVLDDSKSKIKWLNELANQINYREVFIDDYGIPNMIPYMIPTTENIGYTYRDDEFSVMTPEIEIETDWWNVPNIIRRTVSRPDMDPITATYINNNPGDKMSIISRGMRIVDSKTENLAASQVELQKYVDRLGFEARQISQTVTIETMNMPHHVVYDTVEIRRKEIGGVFSEISWDMNLSPGEMMQHKIKRLVV